MKILPMEYLNAAFEIRDGGLFWRSPGKHKRTDIPAGCLKSGYRHVNIGGSHYVAHRIVFAIANGRWPIGEIDHINCVRSDNRPENLRESTRRQNSNNRLTSRNNTSGHKGICWDKQTGKWRARIYTSAGIINLGRHEDLELAAFIYQCAAEKYHGEFART